MTGRVGVYRLHAVAMSTAEVVAYAGGWLFDRAMAGWKVTVMMDDPDQSRALRILGVDVTSAQFAPVPDEPCAVGALAVSSRRYLDDARVRGLVTAALAAGSGEVVAWGQDVDALGQPGSRVFSYRLSSAACEFKQHALGAVAPGRRASSQELFATLVPHVSALPIRA